MYSHFGTYPSRDEEICALLCGVCCVCLIISTHRISSNYSGTKWPSWTCYTLILCTVCVEFGDGDYYYQRRQDRRPCNVVDVTHLAACDGRRTFAHSLNGLHETASLCTVLDIAARISHCTALDTLDIYRYRAHLHKYVYKLQHKSHDTRNEIVTSNNSHLMYKMAMALGARRLIALRPLGADRIVLRSKVRRMNRTNDDSKERNDEEDEWPNF